jgi:choline dehydrogenase-like flavoprotein
MTYLNINSVKKRKFDAIVVGSGMSGGWAAKEFADKGFKTLILERGKKAEHIIDYPTTNLQPWELEHRGRMPDKVREENPIAASCYNFHEGAAHFFMKDTEQPYVQESPFQWIRPNQVGGKSLLWARQTQRWSKYDFEGPARDGFAVEWPIGYDDIAPWYDYVENFVGISGNKDGLDSLPDGDFLPPHEQNCVEKHFTDSVNKNFDDRHIIIGRCAHITEPRQIHYDQGRAKCQHRTICERGCPFGGYFAANSSTIPWALKTGNATLMPNSVVHSLIYDDKKQRAVGVRVIDSESMEMTEYFADVIFMNASALATNHILLNSKSNRFPEGLGNDNGLMGKYVAFHNYRAVINAEYEGFMDKKTAGKRPNSSYVPRFRNVYKQETDFLRGYAAGFQASRNSQSNYDGVGEDLKNNLAQENWGPWRVGSHMMGETIPKEESYVRLDQGLVDKYGIPQLSINVKYDDNDEKMIQDFKEQFTEMYEKAGFTNIKASENGRVPGNDIHEMGGVRMGKDPKTSLLNEWNQLHSCKNVFVTDGACMTSTSTQNPSLTYMALTARAADYAMKEMKKGNL